MKQYATTKTITKILIGFSVLSLFVAVFSTQFYLKADNSLKDIKPSNIESIGSVLDRGLEFLEYFLGSIAFIALVVGGIQFGTADGDPTKIARAKRSIIYAALGIVLSVLSFALTKAAFGLLG
ncbi:MAG: hypothetical protein M1324_02600 [Patescibacteria group bacterium]|nr:hypothetical protein [Patescibacteria group bacterium]